MSIRLKPYPEYKESGIPWLGKVPAHWRIQKTKHLFAERVEKGYPDEPLLAATQAKGVIPKAHYESRTVTALKDLHLLKLVEKGDYVISLRSFQGGIEYAYYRGIISPAYTVLKPSRHIQSDYFRFLFKSSPFIDGLTLFVTGIREGQNIDYEKLSRSFLPVPPFDEQITIGRFLHAIVTSICALIRSKRQEIKLLNEQKQVIINQAVTRGLDQNVRMKPSGIEWIGDVPEHWQMTRLKYLARFVSGGTPSTGTPSFWNGNIPWVSPKDMKYFEIHDTRDHVTERAIQAGKTALVPAGAVLMVVRSGILQRTIPVAVACREVAINQDLKAMMVDDELLLPEFLSMIVIGKQQALLALWRKQGATVESLEYKWILNTVFPVPPVQEQRAILTVLLPRLMEIEKTIEHVQREIHLLREYRTCLIADVVTGKLDVRDVERPDIDVSEGLDEWDEEELIVQEETMEVEEMDVDEDN